MKMLTCNDIADKLNIPWQAVNKADIKPAASPVSDQPPFYCFAAFSMPGRDLGKLIEL